MLNLFSICDVTVLGFVSWLHVRTPGFADIKCSILDKKGKHLIGKDNTRIWLFCYMTYVRNSSERKYSYPDISFVVVLWESVYMFESTQVSEYKRKYGRDCLINKF